jgi:hypothetical protein
LASGAEVDAKFKDQFTALDIAIIKNRLDIAENLIPEFCTQIPLSEVRGQVTAINLVR